MSGTKMIEFSSEARNKMLVGVKTLAKAVGASLGPRGRGVAIQTHPGSSAKVSKDGVSISEAIVFKDPYQQIGAKMVHEAASNCAEKTGDGTSAATVTAAELMVQGSVLAAAGLDTPAIKRGLDRTATALLKELDKLSTPVASAEQIRQVATISANGDEEIGRIVSEAIGKVGNSGIVTIEESQNTETTVRIAQGFEFDRGWVHPYFMNDVEKQRVVFDDALVWLINGTLSTHQQFNDMMPVLESIHNNGQPLIVIAENFEGEPLANLVVNTAKGAIKAVAIKAPGYGARRAEMLSDISCLTGATLRDAGSGDDLVKNTEASELGKIKRIEVYKDRTVLIGPDGRETEIEKHIEGVRSQISQESSKWDHERTEQRLAKLLGGVAVISVGGISQVEILEKKDRYIDSLGSCKSSIKAGICPGGGTALLKCREALISQKFTTGSVEEDHGMKLLFGAISAPFKQILANAGGSTLESAGVLMAEIVKPENPNLGYDAQRHELVDMVKAGILDPTLVIKTALQNAVSVAGQFLTTEAAIVYEPEDMKPHNNQPNMMMG